MATKFTQQSEEYLRQIDAEVERLQELRTQVQATLQPERAVRQASAATKSGAKKSGAKKTAAKRKYTRRAPLPAVKETAAKRSYTPRAPLPGARKSAAKKKATKKTAAESSEG